MPIENIIITEKKTFEEDVIDKVLKNAGSINLKVEMERLKINYSKVERGFKTIFVLRHKDFTNGRIEVVL